MNRMNDSVTFLEAHNESVKTVCKNCRKIPEIAGQFLLRYLSYQRKLPLGNSILVKHRKTKLA